MVSLVCDGGMAGVLGAPLDAGRRRGDWSRILARYPCGVSELDSERDGV